MLIAQKAFPYGGYRFLPGQAFEAKSAHDRRILLMAGLVREQPKPDPPAPEPEPEGPAPIAADTGLAWTSPGEFVIPSEIVGESTEEPSDEEKPRRRRRRDVETADPE